MEEEETRALEEAFEETDEPEEFSDVPEAEAPEPEEEHRRAEADLQARLAEEADRAVRDTYAGQINPYTGMPIQSRRDLDEYRQALRADQLRQAGLEPDVLSELIANDPAVRQARELTERLSRQEGEQALLRAVSEIGSLDPSIRSVRDLMEQPNAEAFHGYVQKGYGLAEAYRLANFDRLTGQKAAAARQAAINSLAGKSHMGPTRGGSGRDVTIPAAELELFRALNPEASDREIMAFYAKQREEG